MKSLLVDALRQLEEGKAPESTEGQGPSESTSANQPVIDPASDLINEDGRDSASDAPAPPEGELPPALELSLDIETDEPASPAPDNSIAPDNEGNALDFDTGDLALAQEDAPDETFGEEESYPLASTMALDVQESPADASLDIDGVRAATAFEPIPVSNDTPWLQRLAVYTPVLCLILGTAAAGVYFAYSYAGAVNLNTDLGSLPEHVSDRFDLGDSESAETAFILGPGVRPASQAQPAKPAAAKTLPPAVPVPEEAPFADPVTTVASSSSPEDLAYPLLEKAYVAWQSGDLDAAELLYREALDIAPGHPNALSGLGAVLQATGRRQEALPVYEQLLSMEPDNVAAAAALLDRNQQGTAGIDEIQGLLVRHPASAPLYFALGSALAQSSDWANARVAFETAFELAPARADYAFNLAVSLEQVGRYGDAEVMYGQALQLASERDLVDRSVVVSRLNELSTLRAGARQ